MKGIILAAGEGRRLRPYTNDRPKCLVAYKGRPILDYAVEAFHRCGINELVIVKGYKGETLSVAGAREYWNHQYDTSNMVYSLFCARPEIAGDIIVSYSDIIYRPEILSALIQSPADFAVTVDLKWRALWERRMEDVLRDAETLKMDSAGRILELGKKPLSFDDIQAQYMGLFKISARAVPEVVKFYDSLDPQAQYDGRPKDKMFMTSFIQAVIDRLMPVYAVQVNGGWLEIDSISDLSVEMI